MAQPAAETATSTTTASSETPSSDRQGPPATTAPPAKRAKKGTEAKASPPPLDEAALVWAKEIGFESALRNLASRPDVMALGTTTHAMVEALVKSGGLVNPARRVLTGCA